MCSGSLSAARCLGSLRVVLTSDPPAARGCPPSRRPPGPSEPGAQRRGGVPEPLQLAAPCPLVTRRDSHMGAGSSECPGAAGTGRTGGPALRGLPPAPPALRRRLAPPEEAPAARPPSGLSGSGPPGAGLLGARQRPAHPGLALAGRCSGPRRLRLSRGWATGSWLGDEGERGAPAAEQAAAAGI